MARDSRGSTFKNSLLNSSRASARDEFLLASLRGLGAISKRELRTRFGDAAGNISVLRMRNHDLLRFSFAGAPSDLLQLGTVEDVFHIVATMELSGKSDDLKTLSGGVAASRGWNAALNAQRDAQGKTRPTWRVVAQAEDAPWRNYRRVELQRAIEAGVAKTHPSWKRVEDNAGVEVWAQVANRTLLVSVRLSDVELRQRDYKRESLPASLRPTIARAMVQLAGVDDADVFLDPMCGAGTILLERALAGRFQLLLGGDSNANAVAASRANFGPRHKPWDLKVWDARRLPVESASVHKIATNPPWGKQVGAGEDLGALYTALFSECERVLRGHGRLVVLSSEREIVKIASARPCWKLIEQVRDVSVLGARADIWAWEKIAPT